MVTVSTDDSTLPSSLERNCDAETAAECNVDSCRSFVCVCVCVCVCMYMCVYVSMKAQKRNVCRQEEKERKTEDVFRCVLRR